MIDAGALRRFGVSLVVAPHPDDESLGCGGLLAMLGDVGLPVFALLMTDGTRSHTGSQVYGEAARAALRDAEWQAALRCLGVAADRLHRLGLVDGLLPSPGDAGFAAAAGRCGEAIDRIRPRTVLVPWRRDPHPDHRATHALVSAALQGRRPPPRVLEYAVWAGERGTALDQPGAGEVRTWRLDIASAVERKRRAIAAHRSQLGEVITDDPHGFTIPPGLRARAERPVEHFFESLA